MKNNPNLNERLSLYAILGLSLTLRLKDLTKESLWFDEAHTLIISRLSISDIIPAIAIDVHPPFYFILMRYWLLSFGESVFSLRFFSVVFAVASVYLIYKIGEEINSKKVGLLAALFLSLSSLHIHYSQEARMYSLVLFFSLASLYFFLRYLERRSSGLVILYALSTTCMLYTQSASIFVLAFENLYFFIYLFFSRNKDFKKTLAHWLLIQVLILLLYLPWALIISHQINKVNAESWGLWVKQASLERVVVFLTRYAAGNLSTLICFLLAIVLASYTDFSKSSSNKLKSFVFPALLFLSVLFIPFVISKTIKELFIIRITLPALVGFYLLTASGIFAFKKPILVTSFGFLLCFFLFQDTLNYYQRVKKEQWKEAVEFVEKNAKRGELVLFNAPYIKDFAYGYYAKRMDLENVGFPEKSSVPRKQDLKVLEKIISNKKRVFLVRAMSFDRNRILENELKKRFKSIRRRGFYQVEVFIFRN